MRIANHLFDRSALSSTKKEAKLAAEKPTSSAAASASKKVSARVCRRSAWENVLLPEEREKTFEVSEDAKGEKLILATTKDEETIGKSNCYRRQAASFCIFCSPSGYE